MTGRPWLAAMVAIALVGAPISGGGRAASTRATSNGDCEAWSPFTPELDAELSARFPDRNFTGAVSDLDRGCTFHLNEGQIHSTASVIKITIMAAALLRAQDGDRDLTGAEEALIGPMIASSDDPSASSLWVSLGGATGIATTLDRFGLDATTAIEPKWGESLTTAADQVELISQLMLGGGPLDEGGRQRARTFMEAVVPSQRWGARAAIPADWPVPMKNGFFDSIMWDWRVNTVGYVDPPDRQGHLLAVLSDGWPAEAPGIAGIEIVATAINTRLIRTIPPGHPFVDVAEGDHFETALVELVQRGILSGVSPMFYQPATSVTRAQLASMLYRLAGSPDVDGASGFEDVTEGSVHAGAIAWLHQQGITTGTTSTTFEPDTPVSRGQFAALLHRFAGIPQPAGNEEFDDVADTDYFALAVSWMVENGITLGIAPHLYGPGLPLNRGQAAALLGRSEF